ncbi:hypothetical protein FRB93_007887 [Tulasnella sp. JGI-2019a]|nr:hypothetical protein FRB93_007887 [Tulasnella sp. JGI-2019a]
MHAPSLVIMALCASPALAAPFKLPKLPFFSSEMMTHQLDLEAARIVAEVETNAMRPAEYAILKDASRAKIIAGDGHGQSTQKLAKERIAKIKKELEAAIKAPKGEDHPAPLDAAIAKEKLRTFKEAAGETDWGKVAGYGAVAAGAGILGTAISHSKSPDPVSVQSTDPTATGVADVTETNTPTPPLVPILKMSRAPIPLSRVSPTSPIPTPLPLIPQPRPRLLLPSFRRGPCSYGTWIEM